MHLCYKEATELDGLNCLNKIFELLLRKDLKGNIEQFSSFDI